MSDESLERPPFAPIFAAVAAGVIGLFMFRWALRTVIGGVKFIVLCAVIGAVIYGVSRLRPGGDD